MKISLLWLVLASGTLAVAPGVHAQKKAGKKKAVAPASVAPAAAPSVAPSATGVVFEGTELNFGKIRQGELVKHSFRFVNHTSGNISIVAVKPSCGCTTPSYSTGPIKPGQSGEIAVVFNSGGKLGPQRKTVVVTLNTEPAIYTLLLQGEVFSESLP